MSEKPVMESSEIADSANELLPQITLNQKSSPDASPTRSSGINEVDKQNEVLGENTDQEEVSDGQLTIQDDDDNDSPKPQDISAPTPDTTQPDTENEEETNSQEHSEEAAMKIDTTEQAESSHSHSDQQESNQSEHHESSYSEQQESNHSERQESIHSERQESMHSIHSEETETKQLLEMNGNSSLHIDDEASCSSSTSSTSSHNLVIDHPLADEKPPTKSTPPPDNEYLEKPSEEKSLKRKLSECENGPRLKRIHLDEDYVKSQSPSPNPVQTEAENLVPKETPPTQLDEVIAIAKPQLNITQAILASKPISPPKLSSPSPYEQYVQSFGNNLPIPKLSFDCFKCKSVNFETFTELREHQKVCLLKDIPAKTPTVPSPSPTPNKEPMPSEAPTSRKKRFFLCSSCGTYHENWNLFLHIREIHNRHVCLYCIRLFPTAEKLSLHLEIKHDLEQNHFNSEEKLRSVSKSEGNSRFLMCCTCQHVFSEHERFSDHICTEYMQPCNLCNQKGRHSNTCKANPEKRPKVKKKKIPQPLVPAKKPNYQPPRSVAGTSLVPSAPASICDNQNQLVLSAIQTTAPTIPPTLHLPHDYAKQNGFTEPPSKQLEDSNYHSDDSTNMVIDETCNNNNYTSETGVNPFKELDEHERRQEEERKALETKPALPPDRAPENVIEPKPLIVPKIKLRVPKEFQKSVESEISSSSDEEDDEVDEGEDDEERQQQNTETPVQNNKSNSNSKGNDSDTCSMDDKENTQEWTEPDPDLNRILKEIEKTKLDIQRTKELLEPMNAMKKPTQEEQPVDSPSPSPLFPPEATHSPRPHSIKEEEPESEPQMSWMTPKPGMCSPTPPASPESCWPLFASEHEFSEKPVVSAIQAGSERENAENIEKEAEESKYPKVELVQPVGLDTSGEVDVESLNDQETMDVDEKPKSPQLQDDHQQRPPSTTMDFTPIVAQKTEETNDYTQPKQEQEEIDVVQEKVLPSDGIEVAGNDIQITDLLLDRPLEKFDIVEFVRLCVKSVFSLCLYCHHARRIAVNGQSLVLHLLAQHRFAATVDSITAEELLPSTIVSKLKSFLPELEEHHFNLESYCTIPPKEKNVIACDERIFECFQCRFSTRMHKDLYLHNRKMHLRTAILCYMCRTNFFSFSEILCHICPGIPNKVNVFDIKFRCCLCEVDEIPSPFRLMVHLRKKHFACDVCLEDCREQGRLSSHVWKHKLHHLCYRCGIAYRNKMDITKHLFWKHGTESIICKRCLQKRWRHVYHFCVPPPSFICDVCNLCFSKATYLKVHKRVHSGDFRYPCTEEDCCQKFVSRKLLLKHSATHAPLEVKVEEPTDEPDSKLLQPDVPEIAEPTPEEVKDITESADENKDTSKEDDKKPDKDTEEVSKRKRKKNRNKESLEDLNLIAPNLSESDSSDDSDVEKPKTKETDPLVPNIRLSPASEEDKEEEKDTSKENDKDTGKIMDIWENFKSYQASQQQSTTQDEGDNDSFSESNYPTPILHVAYSDHDYCAMYKVRPRIPVEERNVEPTPVQETNQGNATSDNEANKNDSTTRTKSISPNKKKRKSTGSGSSSSDSSSGSDSSCSCGSNCSCSSSGSSSNSSSSSDEDSDSSTSEGRRRIAAKKEERANRSREENESVPKNNHSESIDVVVEDKDPEPVPMEPKKPEPNLQTSFFIESDLETAESETDEEFYDEHPQKLASEALAQIRNQLHAKMQLSPSQNYGIVENSRPSTPSLPEDVVKEKKVKLKKRKRDRKSTSKSQAVPPIKLNLSINKQPGEHHSAHQQSMQVPEVGLVPPYDLIASPNVAEPPIAHQPLSTTVLQNNIAVKPLPVPFFHRMSEGSSCSDADNSLKRSKRARRPNKFYGYTSDDENTPGTPLIIGTRTFKPQPPPQLTWRKEDLPAPSKSILLNKQPRSPRTPRTPAGVGAPTKRRVHTKSGLKKKQHKLPPIPTLKIRPPKMSALPPAAPPAPPQPPPPPPVNNNSFFPSQTDSEDSDSSDDGMTKLSAVNTLIAPSWNHAQPMNTSMPAQPAPAPAPVPIIQPTPAPQPQSAVVNRKIPPALIPNPDFATIQYFKRNNIRYPIRPPAGARQPRDGESVYCYCRCPYDEVSEMIACDGENCLIEWFHFECVGIMVAPQGKWFCAECRPNYSNELYPKL